MDSPNVHGCYRIDLASNISCLTGDTDMRFKVVVGDVNGDGRTLQNDYDLVVARVERKPPLPINPGNLGNIRMNVDIDGRIQRKDGVLVKQSQF